MLRCAQVAVGRTIGRRKPTYFLHTVNLFGVNAVPTAILAKIWEMLPPRVFLAVGRAVCSRWDSLRVPWTRMEFACHGDFVHIHHLFRCALPTPRDVRADFEMIRHRSQKMFRSPNMRRNQEHVLYITRTAIETILMGLTARSLELLQLEPVGMRKLLDFARRHNTDSTTQYPQALKLSFRSTWETPQRLARITRISELGECICRHRNRSGFEEPRGRYRAVALRLIKDSQSGATPNAGFVSLLFFGAGDSSDMFDMCQLARADFNSIRWL